MNGVETHSSSPRRLRMDRVDTMAYQVKHKFVCIQKLCKAHKDGSHQCYPNGQQSTALCGQVIQLQIVISCSADSLTLSLHLLATITHQERQHMHGTCSHASCSPPANVLALLQPGISRRIAADIATLPPICCSTRAHPASTTAGAPR